MATSETLNLSENSQTEFVFSQPVCHASLRALPGSEEAKAMTVGSGRQCSMWLNASEQLGVFSKILMESSAWTNSEEYCYVWNRLNTQSGFSAFQLMPLGQNTDDTGYSLLGTPNAKEAGPNGQKGCLRQTIETKLWRTPNAAMVSGGAQDGEKRLASGHALQLTDQAMTPKLWPTPRAEGFDAGGKDPGRSLHTAVKAIDNSGSLNPRFVEELMGYKIDHTALKLSATQSFRPKSSRSSKQSPK
jgi:hypothetical protein